MEFETPPGRAVLVSNILLGYETMDIVNVRLNDAVIQPSAANDFSSLYLGHAQAPLHWAIELASSRPEVVDIVSFDPRASEMPAACPRSAP